LTFSGQPKKEQTTALRKVFMCEELLIL